MTYVMTDVRKVITAMLRVDSVALRGSSSSVAVISFSISYQCCHFSFMFCSQSL